LTLRVRRVARFFRERRRRGVVRLLYGPDDRKVIAEVRVEGEREE
jgi:hypothetical protein